MKLTPIKTLAATAVLCALSSTAYAATAAKIGDTEFTYGGYIKLDAMWSDYSAGAPAGSRSVTLALSGLLLTAPTSDHLNGLIIRWSTARAPNSIV